MLPLEKAKKIAIDICTRLQPWCDRINIAGSIRRGKLEVKDLEIVCLPKKVATGQVDIFSGETEKETVHAEFTRIVYSLGNVIKGKPDGRYMQIEIENRLGGIKTVNLDLFMPQPHDYYRIYAIRTGSADYSAKIITAGWIKQGWRGTEDGLRLEEQCVGYKQPDGKVKWSCVVENPVLPPVWQSEQEFFDWINVPILPPNLRYV